MTRAVWLVILVAVTAACSSTSSNDQAADDVAPAPGSAATAADDSAATTTIVYSGPASDLLPQLAVEMSRLSAQVAEDGNEDDATLSRILAIWAAAKPEVEANRPELIENFDTAVVWSRSAVERSRPADADKGFSVLTDLIDEYTAAS